VVIIFDDIKNRILSVVQGEITPNVEISTGATDKKEDDFMQLITNLENKRASMQDLEKYSTREPLTRKGLCLKSQSIWGAGLFITSDDKKALEICNDIIHLPSFKEYTIETTKHSLGYGMGYMENIWNDVPETDKNGKILRDKNGFKIIKVPATKIIGFNIGDPKTILPRWDIYGRITRYEQKVRMQQDTISFNPEQFSYFRFDRIGDDVRGYGLVEPLIPTIQTIIDIRIDIRRLIHRYGLPFTHIQKIGARKEEIPKLRILAKNITSKKSLASSEKLNIKLLGVDGKVPDFTSDRNFLLTTLAGGLGIPLPELLKDTGRANRASLDRLSWWNNEETETYQEKVSTIIEEQIFRPALDVANMKDVPVPQVYWNPLSEESEDIVNKNNKLYIETINLAFGADAISKKEKRFLIRNKLNIGIKSEVGLDGKP